LTVIEPYVDRSWFLPRDEATVWRASLTVCNGIDRPLFDLEWWRQEAKLGPLRLVGSGNKGIRQAVGPAASWDALREEYARASTYVNPCTGPYEDAHNLAALEAHAAGVPVVSRQEEKWQALVADHDPFDPFDRERFRRQWLVALAESTDGDV
jgi:hypothetical protein